MRKCNAREGKRRRGKKSREKITDGMTYKAVAPFIPKEKRKEKKKRKKKKKKKKKKEKEKRRKKKKEKEKGQERESKKRDERFVSGWRRVSLF